MVNRRLFPEKSAKELLVQFRETGSEEPYEEIVRRYAAMVYGVCLRITQDKHDAEDATQAVFLSLALQAKTSREITYVGPWLQKVAHRLALDVKKAKTRRKKREDKLADAARHNGNGHPGRFGDNGGANGFFGGKAESNPADHPGAEELKSIMMEELNKLPAKYRMPLVLHYFGGLSREEMADELSCNPSTLGVRVHRGKSMLGKRLAKRGVAISAIALAVVLEHVIRTTTVHPLMATASAATVGFAGGSTGACLVAGSNLANTNGAHSAAIAQATARVFAITRTAFRSIAFAKAKLILTVGLLIITAVVTAGSVVAKITDMHVSPLIDVHQWLRPLLDSFTPSLRVDATPNIDVDHSADFPAAPSNPPLEIKVNLDQLGLGTPVPSAPGMDLPAKTQASGGSNAIASVSSVNAIPAPALLASSPSMMSLTREPVGAPVRLPSVVPPTLAVRIGSDTAKKSTDAKTGEDPTKPLIASETGEFSLIGAGGGGGWGKPDTYVLPANANLHSSSMVIGDSGFALFRQDGGNNVVNGTLTLAKKKSSVATYQMNSGTLSAINEVIGDEGDAVFIQVNGINVAQNSVIVGNSGRGSYSASGDSSLIVLNANPAQDPMQDPNGLHLAQNLGSTATFSLGDNATLNADPQIIGAAGDGKLTQTGGTNTTGAIALATQAGSNGTYDLNAGNLIVKVRPTKKPTATISIGVAGKGTFTIGNGQGTGKVTEVGGSAGSVVVRGQAKGDGSLSGYGKVDLTGPFVNNGQVVADGHGKNRTLDLSSFAYVTSNIENARWNGTNGWFARRKGRLLLPAIPVKAGDGTYTWGEDYSDPMIDLVNSVRFDIEGAKQDGDVSIALVSPLRDDIPKLPWGHHFIGVWSFDGSELGGFTGMDLQVRYDDTMAKELKLDEDILKLWRYDTALDKWIRINDASFTRDTVDHLLSGHAPGDDISYFAVSAPEPTGVTLMLLGASAAMLRRRCRKPE